MKHPIWPFIFLLIISFATLSFYSFSDYQLSISGYEIEKTHIKNFVFNRIDLQPAKHIALRDSSKQLHIEAKMDTTSQKILLIGDSMLEGLMLRMRDYVAENNHEMKTVIWYSSSTDYFGNCDTLTYFINDYKPSYVILVLGANELFVRDIISKRTRYVKHILSELGDLKFVWVGPPNWKDDTGINEMILDNVGAQKYFPSKNLTYRRFSDGAHPTHESAAMWMDSIATWIMNESAYPIRMNYPSKRTKNSPNTTILQPLK